MLREDSLAKEVYMGDNSNMRTAVRRGLAGLGAGALLLGGVQIVTQSAASALPGLVRQTATGAPGSRTEMSQTVNCPKGKKVLGGAGRIDGAPNGEVGLTFASPVNGGAGFTVSAAEDANGTTANWTITAIAFCSAPPDGLQYAQHTFAAGSTKSRWSSVTCPKGKKILGAGGRVSGANGRAILTGVTPSEDGRTITATAYEDEAGTTDNWSVTALATCVKPTPGLEVVQAGSIQSSDVSIASATLTCPEGSRLHGVAGEVTGGNGEVRLRQLDATPDSTAVARAAEDADGTDRMWSVHTYGICAK
ncbi:hypothetical protein Vau01_033260 [Virgisporangium aurantiacum]|uniref:Uncharacterized protein n=2 Tax=Virgisporangium aurantiacum TaxID=175570 RepID=A0A8J4DYM2_9ACTN|nr:hypothetical protein Vau01_033260 [Virgisporangium aurantiacum]